MNKKLLIWILAAGIVAAVTISVIGCSRPVGTPTAGEKPAAEKIIEYWTCAMHPSVRSDKPGKCPICGMELIPVEKTAEKKDVPPAPEKAAAEQKPEAMEKPEGKPAAGSISLSKRQQELAGVATAVVTRENVFKEIRASGKIAYDPELNVAQEEFLIARETLDKVRNSPDEEVIRRGEDLVEKSKFRLKTLGMSEDQIAELAAGGSPQRNLIFPEGKVWVYADVYESDLSWIREGMPAEASTSAYPGETFKGSIRAVGPILDPNTRSVKVRMEVANLDQKLKPEMFADVLIRSDLGEAVPVVSRDAVLDTGTRKIVWVDRGGGNYEAKEIQTGPEGIVFRDGRKENVFPVRSGLRAGDMVVTKGNFLIDSQSQLTGGMSVFWGGAKEITEENRPGAEGAPSPAQHHH